MSVHNADADAGSPSRIPGATQSSPSPALIEQTGSICHAEMHLGISTLGKKLINLSLIKES